MEKPDTKKFGIRRFFLSKNVQVIIVLVFVFSCEQEKPTFNYDKLVITNYIADLLLKESAVEFYSFELRDSVAIEMERRILVDLELDSLKIQEDLKLISSDIELTKEYFGSARDILKMTRDSLRSN